MTTPVQQENGLRSPVLIEISNLKAALARYQTAADSANLHLQRQAFDSSALTARCAALEHDIALFQSELTLLRSMPDNTPHPATLQVSELSLALRHVSDKLRLSEEALQEANERLSMALKAKTRMSYEVEASEDLIRRSREEVDGWKARVRLLESEVKGKEEERRIMEVCVKEYADLVRSLEGRPSMASTLPPTAPAYPIDEEGAHSQELSTNSGSSGAYSHSRTRSVASSSSLSQPRPLSQRPLDSLNEGRVGLQRLLAEFHKQTERFEEEIARLHGELELQEMRLEAKEKTSMEEELEIARLRSELAAKEREDRSASMMVEKYMSFSQQSTNLLQTALQTQKKRQAATIATYEAQISALTRASEKEKATTEKLREALDNLTLEMSRESYGRRREVALRLSLIERERKICLMLDKWINGMERGKDAATERGRTKSIETAKVILDMARGNASGWEEEEKSRIELAIEASKELELELARESERRMQLERLLAIFDPTTRVISGSGDTMVPPSPPVAVMKPSEPSKDEVSDSQQKALSTPNSPPLQSTEATPPPLIPRQPTLHANSAQPLSQEITCQPHEDLDDDEDFEIKHVIEELRAACGRYESLQSLLNDCHDALQSLRSTPSSNIWLDGYLSAAIDRLDDYCEDARVELEIVIADEARIAQGYETLLSLSAPRKAHEQPGPPFPDEELLRRIDQFIHGTEPSIEKAKAMFGEKVDNLMHDIAVVKRALHEGVDEPAATLSSQQGSVASPNVPNNEGPTSSHKHSESTFSWRGFTSSVFLPRSSSPAPRTVPTFGGLMTSSRPRRPSTMSTDDDPNPLNRLGLRIAMPKSPNRQASASINIHSPFPFSARSVELNGSNSDLQPKSAPLSRIGSGWLGGGLVKTRTISTVHLPGLGSGVAPSSISTIDGKTNSAADDLAIEHAPGEDVSHDIHSDVE